MALQPKVLKNAKDKQEDIRRFGLILQEIVKSYDTLSAGFGVSSGRYSKKIR